MKRFFTFSAMLCVIIILDFQSFAKVNMKSDSILLSAGYANEAYYSFSSGNVQTAPRATWDIAFRTKKLSSSILINDGSGVVLYTYPKTDTSGWATIDTAGLATWKPLYNDPTDWENGAFSRNASGHPDYGWGKYNDVTHNLTGDSLYVIKIRNGGYKKLWIVGKKSAANIYNFRFANLDGTSENSVSLDLNAFKAADFYGYSIETNEGVSFQPSKASWDILFTKYMSVQPNGTPYPVIGVLSNDTVSSKKFHPVLLTYNDFGAGSWDSTRSSVGWDWKVFDNNTFSFKIVDSTVYFIKQIKGDIYKLYFTTFTGSSTGLVKFNLEKAASAGLFELNASPESLSVYPNPAKDKINIILTDNYTENSTITLTDLSGRQLRADSPRKLADGLNVYSMDVTGVQPGIYFVTVVNAASRAVAKVLITQ
jgi:hypothetical protein